MKLLSWNVNGLRAALGKGCDAFLLEGGYDCICLQETKLQEGLLPLELPGYTGYLLWLMSCDYRALVSSADPEQVWQVK